jgi:hypothetical protein
MGQQNPPDDRLPLTPPLPQSQDTAEQPSVAPAPDELQTVPEIAEALADRLDAVVDDLKKLVQQLKNVE